jgi:eukaryotic-like serine/threonine-protein kinase
MPARLGRYAVRRRVGSGGFATVWLAYDEQLDSPVAVKVLADNWTEDHQIRQRFLEEGRYLRRVESPHVVSVYDAGELEDGRPYLVMSYADQGTLADRLEIEGVTPAQAMEVIRQVAAGLQALHDRDILHRDVKPANVLFRTVESAAGKDVRAMVGDLGLGKALDMSSRLTMIAGTPTFVAPEQAAAESPDARADQYSLAALAFLLLTGRAPYRHASLADAASPGELPPVSTEERPFPDEVEQVLRTALSFDREQRYDDVTAFATALETALGPAAVGSGAAPWIARDPDLTEPGARPTLPPGAPVLPVLPVDGRTPEPEPGSSAPRARRRGRRMVALVACVLALAVGGGAGYAAQRTLGTPSERTVEDDDGTLSVVVPVSWDRADATDGWTPPNASSTYPALSVGTSATWDAKGSTSGEGVFVGLLPSKVMPQKMPQHPECDSAGAPIQDSRDGGDQAVTVVFSGCPAGYTVERVVQVTSNLLLWVQVRSSDRATANRILDDVSTYGL